MIKKIRIEGFLGANDTCLEWELNPDVNILAGANGTGKSVLLKMLYAAANSLRPAQNTENIFGSQELYKKATIVTSGKRGKITQAIYENGKLTTAPQFVRPTTYLLADNFNPILNPYLNNVEYFDSIFLDMEAFERLQIVLSKAFPNIQIHFLDKEARKAEFERFRNNFDLIRPDKALYLPSLFAAIDSMDEKMILPHFFMNLRGEKQTLSQLTKAELWFITMHVSALMPTPEAKVLIIDTPEQGIYLDKQEVLIQNLRTISPNLQIIVATNSPAIPDLRFGTEHYITQIEELIKPISQIVSDDSNESNNTGNSITFEDLLLTKPFLFLSK
jgi:AAA15 family ATPase/GTPase